MQWHHFIYFAISSLILWTIGAYYAFREKRKPLVYLSTIMGLCVFFAFILGMWISQERPPLRTMGETRLWYSFFLPLAGIIVYSRWQYKWILTFSTILSTVFICVNIFKPGIHDATLMPALQSPWFAPHVIVYMFAYALLGAATLMALFILIKKKKVSKNENPLPEEENNYELSIINSQLSITDNLVNVGMSFLTFGMLFGALWAKEAWGHYWSWDPKETWAAATWLCYLIYIHMRLVSPRKYVPAMIMLLFSFCCLQMCWWGINYLPSAQGRSVHTYSAQ